ncbi:Hsp20/alpha crystallin family protein [uncultured Chitinophaga sp.]|uniref:Hsp20/alpha crystallin family protein n=1 Tax=uncultured Chitinophaga sp. TaxID=339340 RepID=UPI0026397EB0|nr:Hsp20/alpha crystallin family protein [uncultured Chitinophaga sp.]
MKTLSLKPDTLFPALWDDFFSGWMDMNGKKNKPFLTVPAVNITEEKDAFKIAMAVPGMKKEDFRIDASDGLLTVSSEKESRAEEMKDNYRKQEYNYSSFTRSFEVPESVIASKIEAKYTEGILEITLPKKEETKTSTSVNVAVK